jgi:hypothetical protein
MLSADSIDDGGWSLAAREAGPITIYRSKPRVVGPYIVNCTVRTSYRRYRHLRVGARPNGAAERSQESKKECQRA